MGCEDAKRISPLLRSARPPLRWLREASAKRVKSTTGADGLSPPDKRLIGREKGAGLALAEGLPSLKVSY